jgi:hypothetical protein
MDTGRRTRRHFSFEPCGSGDIETPAFQGGGFALAEGGYGGIGRHARFRFWCRKAWEFKSLYPYQIENVPVVRRRNATGPAGAGPADLSRWPADERYHPVSEIPVRRPQNGVLRMPALSK